MKRGSSSSRFDWLSKTGCIRRQIYFQCDEVEFPAASQTDCDLWTFRDSQAADRASLDALRPLNNLITEDQHELAFIRETPASRTRSLSTSGRARAFPRPTRAGSEASRFKSRWWNPDEPRLFTPKVFGWGYDINLARVFGRSQKR